MIELTVVGANAPALVDDCWAGLIGYRWRLCKGGYVYRKVHGKRIYLHHIVMPGDRWPQFVRDHINRNKLDNTAANLRWVTAAQNTQNRDASKCNATGVRGVRFDEAKGQYLARVQHNGKAVVRAWFDTTDEAKAFLDARRAAVLPFAA
jgi:hypothetical protein